MSISSRQTMMSRSRLTKKVRFNRYSLVANLWGNLQFLERHGVMLLGGFFAQIGVSTHNFCAN